MDEAQLKERADRYDRETRICKGYAGTIKSYIQLSTLGIVIALFFGEVNTESFRLIALTGWAGVIGFGGLYQYFVFRYLEGLGTRYDLLPIVKRPRLLSSWANKPIVFYVMSLMSFYIATVGMILEVSGS